MEDEVIYTTVVYNRPDNEKRQQVMQTEQVVYSEIRQMTETTEKCSLSSNEEVAESKLTSCKLTTACLRLTCVLLLGGVVALSYFIVVYSTEVSKNKILMDLYNNKTSAYMTAQSDSLELGKENEELTAQRDQFNKTLQFILQFHKFPVNKYCTKETLCKPCMENWIQNGSSCYFFCLNDYWKTWEDSQKNCLTMGGSLAVIESPEEQEFINQHTRYYYDNYHGYWIGLYKSQKWSWTTGMTAEGTGFWITPPEDRYSKCVLSKPSNVAVKSWVAADCGMWNRWICEMKAMSWPNGI